jgi:pimeloyl-ACP methyl ester carboxylesterase
VSLVLVPGLGLGAAAWAPTLRRLGSPGSHDVVELPGFGRRPGGVRAAVPGPVAAAGELLDRLPGGGPFVLAGHSASCQVVAHAAARRPDLVAGLVLVGPTTDPRATTWPALAGRWLATARHEAPGQVPGLVRHYARTGPVAMLRTMDAARGEDVRTALREASRPVVVVRGPHDRICPEDWALQVAEAGPRGGSPRSAAVTLPAGAHMVPITHGPDLARVVERFLASLGAG